MQNSINTAAVAYKKELPVASEAELSQVVDTQVDPLDKILISEELSRVLNTCQVSLTDVEKTVVYLKAAGLPYSEIACRLGMSEKNVDNAIQRARRKLKDLCAD
jgi:RNA polymerase sigma factor (sigma-70 family)